MISLYDTLLQLQFYNKIDEEYCNIKKLDIINEGFKSSILNKLAKTIHDVNAYARQYKFTGIETFASIFAPVRTRGGNIISGVKWSEITDNDVKKFDGDDQELIKLVRKAYAKKIKAVFIVCDKSTEDIEYFIKGYIYEHKDYTMQQTKPQVYEFSPNYQKPLSVKKITLPNGYSERDMNVSEVIDLLSDNDVYFIEITEDMVQSFKTTLQDRTEIKKGIIYYDENSLKEYKKKQKARYDAIVKEMKAKKLIENRKKLFDDLKKTNDEIIVMYERVISKPEYVDKGYNLSRLMDYISRAYDYYYRYIKSERELEVNIKSMEEDGESPERIKRYSTTSVYKSQTEDNIRTCEEYLNNVKEDLEKLKNELNKN